MKKYGVIYNYEKPVKVGEIEVSRIVRNPVFYILFTNEGVKRFRGEDLTEEQILDLIK
jgi:hypothetical protein